MDIQIYLLKCQNRINQYLKKTLPSTKGEPRKLHQAMRYAVLNGGKRLRSALIYATGEALGANPKILDRSCAAIEFIHAFSLVHDDLPALDNDALRRGKPSCHVAFDEATAILAGDALLALSFEMLTHIDNRLIAPENNIKMIQLLSHYIGSYGMAGGEALDTAIINKKVNLQKLTFIYVLKTGCLISASILLGALSANCRQKKILENLKKFGLYVGLAFQIHDDIIGIESDTKVLGKPQGSDLVNRKPTYPQLLGLPKSTLREQEYYNKALSFLKKSKINSNQLVAISEYLIERRY